ncbi:transcriptional regulator [Sphaerisporangium siamense]|uniref:DNA-binding XRE family transcriptional regulator n=1 Tax=Sphaerisporangium siamense TaxID=795645 RepID=A0A7W7D7Z4_9ACTN|nr:XRE family transcriptional regulator [Sphaerisporangium siamense]MBB4701000.1 DNA-binding XRE family transcriptional regulator [Sphaerisporangium siamense]GII85855.1 transcriptional regulator [Sphaerisporangium siamense]
MTTVGWEETKRKVHERREAAGLPVRSPEQKRAAMDRLIAETRGHRLAEIRQEQSLTQRDVAVSMGVSAPRVSAIEHGEVDRAEVSTLRSYVEALGGKLRVVADFGDTEYRLA